MKKIPSIQQKDLEQAMEVASTSEAAEYLKTRITEILGKAGEKFQPLIEMVGQFTKATSFQNSESRIWDGKQERGTIEKIQEGFASESARILKESIGNQTISHAVAVSDSSDLMRGFALNNENVDAETARLLDMIFNEWLAEHQVISEDSVLYNLDGTRADPEMVRKLINDPDKGFAQHMKKRGFDLTTQLRRFPETKAAKSAEKAKVPSKAESQKETPAKTTEPGQERTGPKQ